MWALKKSRLFKRQLMDFAKWDKDNAGQETAERFVDAAEKAIHFVQAQPLACRVYHEAKTHPQLQHDEFRKWSVKGFPHSLFFRLSENQEIFLEAIYVQRMHMMKRLSSDTQS